MKYIINVAKSFPKQANGRPLHYFRVEIEEGLSSETRAQEVYGDLRLAFPEALISVSAQATTGHDVTDEFRFNRQVLGERA